jgi:hypothetical protein
MTGQRYRWPPCRLLLSSISSQSGVPRSCRRKGLTLGRGRKLLAAGSEDIYAALGLPSIEPELREGHGEVERAMKGKLPSLVTERDVRGILHAKR